MTGDPTGGAERPAPSASGTFAKTPFAHVLMYVRERALSGTLAVAVEADDTSAAEIAGESLLAFERGRLAQARLPAPLDTLGEVLRDRGLINQAQLDASLAALSGGAGLQGRLLVAVGACDEAAIEAAVRDQVRRKALRIFASRGARYAYYDGADLLAGWGAPERFADELLPIVWRGVRVHADAATVEGVLARVERQALRLRSGGDELRLFEFDRAEQSVLDALRAGPCPVERLERASGGDGRLGRLLAYALLIAKQVDVVPLPAPAPAPAQRPAPSPPARPVTAPRAATQPAPSKPAALAPELGQKLVEAEARLAAMQDETYFQMLGVGTDASDDVVRQAFAKIAAQWHPDRVAASAEPVREAYQRVFALLNEAQQTLSDDTMRGRYLATVQEGGGTPNAQRRMVALIEAATDAQKAEICVRRREYDEAVRLARRALKVNADDPNTLAVLAHALVERAPPGDAAQVAALAEAEQLLVRAVEIAPKHDRAHTLLGTVLKRRGNGAKALAHFKLAMEANPRNLDATREVRLANMRGGAPGAKDKDGGDKPPPEGGGLLSRWLKR